MTGKAFVDSNVLIYAHDLDAGIKQKRARECLRELWEKKTGRLSTQVLQEFYVNVTQKIKQPLPRDVAREVIRNYGLWVESPITSLTVVRASEISETWKLAFWDGMIIAAAEQDGVMELLSEDLHAGQVVAGVRISNPFL